MKKLLTLPLALTVLVATCGGSQAGLFDGLDDLFETKPVKTNKNIGRIVWRQSKSSKAPLKLAALQVPPAPGIELAPGEYLVPTPESGPAAPAGRPAGLFPHVKYEDRDNVHPCAVKMVVQVMDPCPPHQDPCSCTRLAPGCVLVEICVPPCGCRDVKVSDGGREVEYDFGEYEVEIKSEDGMLVVNYDD